MVQQFPRGGPFDHVPGIHHDHHVGDIGHHADVVGDQYHAHLPVRLQVGDQFQDLRLDSHVQCRGRLVGDQHVGVQRERHRQHDPLPHAAGELVRVVLDPLARGGDPDPVEHFGRAAHRLPAGQAAVHLETLGDLPADRLHRVQRGQRVLEHHGDPVADDPPAAAGFHRDQVVAAVAGGTGDDPARRHLQDAGQGLHRHALAGAGLAEDGEGLAGPYPPRDTVDGAQPPVPGVEVHRQVLDLQQHLAGGQRTRAATVEIDGHRSNFGSRASRIESPTIMNEIVIVAMNSAGQMNRCGVSR